MMCHGKMIFFTIIIMSFYILTITSKIHAAPAPSLVDQQVENVQTDGQRGKRSQEEIQGRMTDILNNGQKDILKLLQNQQRQQLVFQQQQFVVAGQPDKQKFVQEQEEMEMGHQQNVILQHQQALQQQQQRLQQEQLNELINQQQ